MVQTLDHAWRKSPRPSGTPMKASFTLYNLVAAQSVPQPLFAEERDRVGLAVAMDRVNRKFGANSVYFGAMHEARKMARTGIAFNYIPKYKPEYS